MSHSLIDPRDSIERQNEKLLKIASALMRRVEQASADSGEAFANFERALMLEAEVRARTRDLEQTLQLLNESNARLAQAMSDAERARAHANGPIELAPSARCFEGAAGVAGGRKRARMPRDAGLPAGAAGITRELRELWLPEDER